MDDVRVQDAILGIDDAGGLWTPHELADLLGVSEQAIAKRIKRGTFADPVKIAGRARLYLLAQVADELDADRVQQRLHELGTQIDQLERTLAHMDGDRVDLRALQEQLAERRRQRSALLSVAGSS